MSDSEFTFPQHTVIQDVEFWSVDSPLINTDSSEEYFQPALYTELVWRQYCAGQLPFYRASLSSSSSSTRLLHEKRNEKGSKPVRCPSY